MSNFKLCAFDPGDNQQSNGQMRLYGMNLIQSDGEHWFILYLHHQTSAIMTAKYIESRIISMGRCCTFIHLI